LGRPDGSNHSVIQDTPRRAAITRCRLPGEFDHVQWRTLCAFRRRSDFRWVAVPVLTVHVAPEPAASTVYRLCATRLPVSACQRNINRRDADKNGADYSYTYVVGNGNVSLGSSSSRRLIPMTRMARPPAARHSERTAHITPLTRAGAAWPIRKMPTAAETDHVPRHAKLKGIS
jgi:hypothetical protein